MILFAFDHFYTTTFEQGSNLGDAGLKLVNTYIKDVNDITRYSFEKGETIKLNVSQWLNLADVDLDSLNHGTLYQRTTPLLITLDWYIID